MKKIITIVALIALSLNFSFANGLTDGEKSTVNKVISGYLTNLNSTLVATNLVKDKVSSLETKLDSLKSNPKFINNERIQDLVKQIGISIDNWYSSQDSKVINLGTNVGMFAYNLNDFCKTDKDGVVSCVKNPVPDDLGTVKKIVAGDNHFCAIRKKDSSVKCWGDNSLGQTNVPNNIGETVYLSAASNYTCSVNSDKEYYCWGDDKNGLLKIKESVDNLIGVVVGKNNVCLVSSNTQNNAVFTSQTETKFGIKCYGDDSSSQLTNLNNYLNSGYVGDAKGLAIGDKHICLNTYFTFNCYGNNKYGQSVSDGLVAGFNGIFDVSDSYTVRLSNNKVVINGEFGIYWNQDLINKTLTDASNIDSLRATDDMICAIKKYDKTETNKEQDGGIICIKK